MDLLLLSVALFVAGTMAALVAAGSGFIVGRRLIGGVTEVKQPKINPAWISGGPVTLDEPQQELKSHNTAAIATGVGVTAVLLLIAGAFLASAITFVIGAFTAGSGWGVFFSSFFVGFLTLIVLFFAAKKGVGALKSFFGGKRPQKHHHKTGVEAVKAYALLYTSSALVFASFWLFVGGIVRII